MEIVTVFTNSQIYITILVGADLVLFFSRVAGERFRSMGVDEQVASPDLREYHQSVLALFFEKATGKKIGALVPLAAPQTEN